MKKTMVKCPKCGAEFDVLAANEHVATCTVIGEDSGLGTIYLPVKNDDDKKREMLKSMGLNMEQFMQLAQSMGMTMPDEPKDEQVSVQAVREQIKNDGYVRNPQLARRWITGQVLGMMYGKDEFGDGFTAALKQKGFEYQFDVITDELRTQAAIEHDNKRSMKRGGQVIEIDDAEYLTERQLFWNKEMLMMFVQEYVDKLESYIKSKHVRRCHGMRYVILPTRFNPQHNGMVFEADLYKKVYWPIRHYVSRFRNCKNAADMLKVWNGFKDLAIKLRFYTNMCPSFVDAYKGAGAYYTMKNLIAYHGMRIHTSKEELDMYASLDVLYDCAQKKHGWQLMGMLREFLDYNNFNYAKKVAEWRK